MTSPGIVATGVRRSFGDVHAVRHVSLEARAGAVTGLVGPNGSGKTTLLLMLASLLAPDAGTLRIGGIDPVSDPAGVRRIMGWMPDALGAWSSLTARETLVMTSRLYGIAPDDAARGAARLLAEVGLSELADTPARVFSRGQKQRLGLARALVHDPQVLLLDEPASGLDPQARVDLRVQLRRLAAEGRTILISSHILSELEEVVDDAVFLVDGSTVSSDRVAQAATRVRTWRIRLADREATAAVLPVAQVLGLDAALVPIDRRDLLVGFDSDASAAAALAALVGAGLPVAEFAAATGLLEHTFLDLEGGRS
ncbi:ABC transporter ATP-binding protein [Microbacterium lacticum]|uniref:ABC-type multidrug transport system ATPase subunit n=1 Tax=Microbacterium lacticum TaxID=33885 RepID=A0A4Y3UQI0_9MICO|nr:ABC transporter ATP-binding protein [Microbacterium lacticum]TQM91350.1 ABC-type multidrug transport system ATPase subunit [Microbacterium lacticum]GEB96017.1 multidrug ABC transporter ATP-binding protein [Microbacterium lacticum]GGI71233.1 multidrug ABC transporter ATP-binding protein [Microbacterium lacticum]